jgi:hypothetical protein
MEEKEVSVRAAEVAYRLFLGVYELPLEEQELVEIIVALFLVVNGGHHFV